MKRRSPISIERLNAILTIRPASKALETLTNELHHVPTPNRRLNHTQKLLNLICAVDGSFGAFGLALFIDYGTGAEYDDIMKALEEIGALVTFNYLSEGKAIIGGVVPEDEIERSILTESHDYELRELDLRFRNQVLDEAADKFMVWLAGNVENALPELNQTPE